MSEPYKRIRFTEDIMPIVTDLAAKALSGAASQRQAQFPAFEQLQPRQQNILASSCFPVGPAQPPLTGKDLYDFYRLSANPNDHKKLAGFLNQTAAMAARVFPNGKTALDYVQSVRAIAQDRILANVAPELQVWISRGADKALGKLRSFVGPENSGTEHGIHDLSFRENVESGSQQFSFNSRQVPADKGGFAPFTSADIDIDDYLKKGVGGMLKHVLGEGMPNMLPGKDTDPYEVHERLTRRGINPGYTPPFH